jgi:hypothetical protein
MHLLRGLAIRRWVLACFVFAVGAATAAPLLNPQSMQLLCSSDGVVKLISSSASSSDTSTGPTTALHTLDCALCLPALALQAPVQPLFSIPRTLAQALPSAACAVPACLSAPPLPPRGPPAA